MLQSIQAQVAAATTLSDALKCVAGAEQQWLKLRVRGCDGSGGLWIKQGQKIIAASGDNGKTGMRAMPYLFSLTQPQFHVEEGRPALAESVLDLDLERVLTRQAETCELLRPPSGLPARRRQLPDNITRKSFSTAEVRAALMMLEEDSQLADEPGQSADSVEFYRIDRQVPDANQEQEKQRAALPQGPDPSLPAYGEEADVYRIDIPELMPEEDSDQRPQKVTWQTENVESIREKLAARGRVPLQIIAAVTVIFSTTLCAYAFHGDQQQQLMRMDEESVALLADEAVDAESLAQESPDTYRTAAAEPTAAPTTSYASPAESQATDETLAKKLAACAARIKGLKKAADKDPAPACYTASDLKQIEDKMRTADQLSASGKFNEAAALYASAVSQYPKHVKLRVNAIRAFIRIKQADTARTLCLEGIDLASNDADRAILTNLLNNLK